MAFYKLDAKGKRIPNKGRTGREPVTKKERGKTLYHYEIYVSIPQPGDKTKQIRKRFWLPDDIAAQEKQREIKHEPPRDALTWVDGHKKWLDFHQGQFSAGHVNTSIVCIRQWSETFGKDSTIEGTTLAQYSRWIDEKALEGTGRAAQIKHEHMLAIARWCRSKGLVEHILFEHAKKPKARTKKRTAATGETYVAYLAILPENMRHLWRMLAYTSMRITAACELKEEDIHDGVFYVFTKFREWVPYPLTPEIREIIEAARTFKSKRGISSPYLFTKNNGRPWKKDYFNSRLKDIVTAENEKRANEGEPALPKIVPHQLRHMGGTTLAEETMSPDIITAGLAQKDRRSADSYIDPTMKMRTIALTTIGRVVSDVEKMYKKDMNLATHPEQAEESEVTQESIWEEITCPHCHHKHIRAKE